METRIDHMNALDPQIASNDAEIVSKVVHADSLEGHLWMAEEATSLILPNVYEHSPKILQLIALLSDLR